MSEENNDLLKSLMSALGENPAEKIGQMLNSISSGEKEESTEIKQETPQNNSESQSELPFDFNTLLKLQSLMSQFQNAESDQRNALLSAIRPFISEERRPQLDRAAKLLKLSNLAQAAKDMDVLKNLF